MMRDLGGCSLWVHGDAGVTLNGGNVSAWADQSGAGTSLVQATGAAQPLFVAGAVTGHGAVRFDGVNHFMAGSFTIDSTACTVFIVYKSITIGASGANDIIFDGTTAASMLLFTDSSPKTGIYNGTVLSGAKIADGAYVVATCVFHGASSILRANGSQIAAGAAGTAITPAGGMTLGALANGARKTNIEVTEIAAFNRLFSSSEYSFAEQQLRAEYAV